MPSTPPKTAALVLIGNELLSGKVVDENGPLVVRELRRVGVDLVEMAVIPDDHSRISHTVAAFSQRYDVVFTSGGVGPTHDDITMPSIAAGFDVPLQPHDEMLEKVRLIWGADAEKLRVWSRMALLPRGCELVHEEGMVWPVFRMHNVYILPGVPALFRRQFLAICGRFSGAPVHLKTVYFNVGEGHIADRLTEASNAFDAVDFGSYPVWEDGVFRTRVTLESRDVVVLGRALASFTATFTDGEITKIVEGDHKLA